MKGPAAVLSACLLAVVLAGTVIAGPLEDAKGASDRGDYTTALLIWRQLANQGNAEAQTNLGWLFHDGHGVPQDYDEAIKWFQKAAAQGNAAAQHALGWAYQKGYGVPQNYVEAARWYCRSADQGYSSSQLALGMMYGKGGSGPHDNDEAIQKYCRPAVQANATQRTLYTWIWVSTDFAEVLPSTVAGAWTLKCSRLGSEAGAKTAQVSIEVNPRVFGRPGFDHHMEDGGIYQYVEVTGKCVASMPNRPTAPR